MINPLPRRHRAGLLVACSALSLRALAGGPVPVDEEAQALDQTIQALKQDVLDIDSRGQAVEQNLLFPAYSRVNVYIGCAVSGLLLKKVTVSIDDGAPTTYSYTDDEARNLQEKPYPLHRLLRANATPGSHRLKADFVAQRYGAKPDAAPLTGHYEAFFSKDNKPSELELNVEGGGFAEQPGLRLRDWRAAR